MSSENKCPWCEHEIEDMWEYDLKDGDAEEYECPSCNKKIEISLSVSYDYSIKASGCDKHILAPHSEMEYYSGKKFMNFECTNCKNEFYDHDLPPPLGKEYGKLVGKNFVLTPKAQQQLDLVIAERPPHAD